MVLDERRLRGAEYPARRRGGLAARGTQRVGIVDLDQRGLLDVVGIDDAAQVVVVILPQQFVQRVDADRQFVTAQRPVRQSLAELGEEPLAALDPRPYRIKMLPLQLAIEPPLQACVK